MGRYVLRLQQYRLYCWPPKLRGLRYACAYNHGQNIRCRQSPSGADSPRMAI